MREHTSLRHTSRPVSQTKPGVCLYSVRSLHPNTNLPGRNGPETLFFYQITPAWNSLPAGIVEADSIDMFKACLKRYAMSVPM